MKMKKTEDDWRLEVKRKGKILFGAYIDIFRIFKLQFEVANAMEPEVEWKIFKTGYSCNDGLKYWSCLE